MIALRSLSMVALLTMGLLLSGIWGGVHGRLDTSTTESFLGVSTKTAFTSFAMRNVTDNNREGNRAATTVYSDLTEARLEFYSSAFSSLQNDEVLQSVELFKQIQQEINDNNDPLLNPLRDHIDRYIDVIEYMSEGESCNVFETTGVTKGWPDWLSETKNDRNSFVSLIEAEQTDWDSVRFGRLTSVIKRQVNLLGNLLTGTYTNTYRAVVQGALPCQVAQYVNGIFRFMEADKALLQDLIDALDRYAVNPIFHWSGKIVYKQTEADDEAPVSEDEAPVGEDVELVLRHTDSGHVIRRVAVDAGGKFSIEVPMDNMPLGSYAIETNVAGGMIAEETTEEFTSFALNEDARQQGLYRDDLHYVIRPDFEALPTLAESVVSVETSEGDREQADIIVKGVQQLRVNQPGYVTVRITTNDFVESNDRPGQLPNIIHGKVILATDEQAEVDRGGRLLDVAMKPDQWASFWDLRNMEIIQMFNKATKMFLGGKAGTWLDLISTLFDDIMDNILKSYLLGQPAHMMDSAFLDESEFDTWTMNWSFSKAFYLVQNYTNGVRVTFPVGFESSGTHELKFYTGFYLSPPSGLLDLAPPFGVIVGNNAAKRVGLLFSEAVDVEAQESN